MALKETLKQLREREEQQERFEQEKPGLIADWRKSVDDLLADVKGYLEEYVSAGSVSIQEHDLAVTEERLGAYQTKALSIVAGPATVIVAPVGRVIIGASGRIDLYRQGRGGEQDRIMILRMVNSATDPELSWFITMPPDLGTPAGGYRNPHGAAYGYRSTRREKVSKVTFEQCLEYLLSK